MKTTGSTLMNAGELARMMDTWSDAMNVAEVVGSPFLRTTDQWDLRDWQTVELPNGLKFERLGSPGHVTEAVVVVNASEGARRMVAPSTESGTVPTWLVMVGGDEREILGPAL
ncbi:MAG: hypothetical protein K2R98_02540 [Gemmataceae bacterium]|nr:hypothetical protein [Gemmataceae bacterium]